jgi:hypothetical protein
LRFERGTAEHQLEAVGPLRQAIVQILRRLIDIAECSADAGEHGPGGIKLGIERHGLFEGAFSCLPVAQAKRNACHCHMRFRHVGGGELRIVEFGKRLLECGDVLGRQAVRRRANHFDRR